MNPGLQPARVHLADAAATEAFGARLAASLPRGALVFLHGDLGAGKTTLVRGILRGLGYDGSVKSPTYTLLEPYDLDGLSVYHFDLYRVADSEELDFIGIDELMESDAIKLVEWPEQAADRLPPPLLEVYLHVEGEGRRLELEIRS
ncbi:MAG: tRNA (adenosine(37)-N6)-threonylcarbamoyltransferase complex ATPase subunit type 1 TsaE [Pseudomonadales bacterium]